MNGGLSDFRSKFIDDFAKIKSNFRIVFWMVFGILLGTGVFYLVFADGEIQHWNSPIKSRRRSIDNESRECREENSSKIFSSNF